MPASGLPRPPGDEWRDNRRQLRPARQGARSVVGADRKRLDGKDMQHRAGRSGLAPEVEQGRDIEPGPEPQFAYDESPAALPGVRQATAAQEDRAGLGQPILSGEVDIAKPA
jgi:hypothetical protein